MAIKRGRWLCTTCGLSVPRQNGKTGVLQGRAAAGMVLYNETVIYTAHLQKTATETFEELADFFDTPAFRKYIKAIKTAIGREQIILQAGAKIKFLARTRNGGRGQHGDLLIIDEAQELDSNQQASFLPAISASLNPQTVYAGTPPDPECTATVFRGIRKKALSGDTNGTSWTEFSVKEIGNVKDPKRWAATNPALGRRILLTSIQGECEQMDPDTFARERLGWWSPEVTVQTDSALNAEQWLACASPDGFEGSKIAYGIKFAPDGAMVYLAGAMLDESKKHSRVELIEQRATGHGIQWLADWLNERVKKGCCVVIDGRNGVEILIDRIKDVWKAKTSIIRPSAKDVIASVDQLTMEISERTLTWFDKQQVLSQSALSATKRAIGSGWGFGGEDSGPISAAALALWGCRTSKRNPAKRMRIG